MMRGLTWTLICGLLVGCATSPTGRTQLKLFPDSQMAQMGAAAYEDIKKQTPVTTDPALTDYVTCVADAITRQVKSDARWEVTVFDSEQVNAFALPGGKIGVYTGLLDVAQNQHQLAAVIGHEVGHVIADHGNARVSTQFATSAGLELAAVLSGAGASPQKQQLLALLGLGAQVGILLPYGRAQETESDVLGLEYMARAGFDPRESIELWRRMGQKGSGQPPEFLSTHPSHGTRIETLREHMPDALQRYEAARARGENPQCGPPPSN